MNPNGDAPTPLNPLRPPGPPQSTQPPPAPALLDIPRILSVMQCGSVREEQGMLRWSSNYAFVVSLNDPDLSVRAVYKPQRGERPLWDFPDGTLCYRERAAFVVSEALGWRIVPPTVLREGPRGLGSVQYYIEHNPEVNFFSLDETAIPQLLKVAAFDYIINNADRKGGHLLQDCNGKLWGIDHGIAFNAVMKLRTVIWDFAGQPIPDEVLTDLVRLQLDLETLGSPLRMQLDQLLAGAEIAAFSARLRRLNSRREYPRPGPGPNYPWPPV